MAVAFHDSDGTVSFQQRKVYRFNQDQSVGDVEDYVVVPNIPMLVSAGTHLAHTWR